MTAPGDARPARLSPVVELRQYDLVPGTRETLIGVFDSHLVEGQEAEEMVIIGQFRDLDNPDSFVWLRGFADMEVRKRALTGFYSGPVWLANRDAANATMLRFDNVLLLTPAGADGGFALDIADRRPRLDQPSRRRGHRCEHPERPRRCGSVRVMASRAHAAADRDGAPTLQACSSRKLRKNTYPHYRCGRTGKCWSSSRASPMKRLRIDRARSQDRRE